MSLLDWVKAAFPVQRHKKDEVNFPCPYCGHESFYFNLRKKIGYCHRASCGRKPNLSDLIALKGYGPSDFYQIQEWKTVVAPNKELEIPGWNLFLPGQDNWAIEALGYRGVTRELISKWNIHATFSRIYVPIVEDGKVVQYIGRAIDREKHPKDGFRSLIKPKYKYAEGQSISNFIFGWGHEMMQWPYLVLVENTFNAIAWRGKFNCSTNFGSHLSTRQIELLQKSKISQIILAWDGDAHQKAYDTAKALEACSIKPSIVYYNNVNQPDELPTGYLQAAVTTALHYAPHHYGPYKVTI